MINKVEVGDDVPWQGRMRKVTKLVAITVVLDGVEDVICLPLDATRAEIFKDEGRQAAAA
jgi:hypothetical protein